VGLVSWVVVGLGAAFVVVAAVALVA